MLAALARRIDARVHLGEDAWEEAGEEAGEEAALAHVAADGRGWQRKDGMRVALAITELRLLEKKFMWFAQWRELQLGDETQDQAQDQIRDQIQEQIQEQIRDQIQEQIQEQMSDENEDRFELLLLLHTPRGVYLHRHHRHGRSERLSNQGKRRSAQISIYGPKKQASRASLPPRMLFAALLTSAMLKPPSPHRATM